jgi:hypothetical protein
MVNIRDTIKILTLKRDWSPQRKQGLTNTPLLALRAQITTLFRLHVDPHAAMIRSVYSLTARFAGRWPENSAVHNSKAFGRQCVIDTEVMEISEIRCVVSGIALPDRFRICLPLRGEFSTGAGWCKRSVDAWVFE